MSESGDTVRIAGVIRQSIVDGPGLRMVVFTQGCPHGCAGCHNPETHDFAGGYDCELEKLLAVLDKNPLLAGMTFSGGEPFERAEELVPLAEQVRERGKNIWCYSGYTFEELLERAGREPAVQRLLSLCDVLVDGRFEEEQKDLTLHFRGSRNQRILDMAKSLAQGEAVQAETAQY